MSISPGSHRAEAGLRRPAGPPTGRRTPTRLCRDGFLAAAAALALLIAVPGAAVASTSTSLLGNTSIPRIPRDGTPANSDCPPGSTAIGARIWYDEFPRITGVATWCGGSGGSASLSDVAGDASGPFGDSRCSGTDLAIGLYGSFGEVMNSLGVRCAGAGGTYEAARIGRTDRDPSTADCPAGSVLTGLTAWYGPYGANINVYGVQGSCDVLYTVSQVLQPINADGSSIFKAGRTVPVKFTATDAAGAPVTDLTASLSVTMLTNSVEGTYVEAETNVAASTGFRYDDAAGQYIFNWSTQGLAGGTYRILVTITNGPTITADLSLR